MFCVTEERAQRMSEIAAVEGARHGYDQVDARFEALDEFKIKWMRGPGWIDLTISDYLADAPDEVLEDLFGQVFGRISGDDAPYPESVRQWLTSPDFAAVHRPAYLARHRRILGTTKGEHRDLMDSVRRLEERGLLPEGTVPDRLGVMLTWVRPRAEATRRTGATSVLFRVAGVLTDLDSDEFTDEQVDLVVFAQLCGIVAGFAPPEGEVVRMIGAFPDFREVEASLIAAGRSLEVE